MKKTLVFASIALGLSFILSGLQSSFYFFPIPLPAFWFIIFAFYSFRKSLSFSLLTNLAHAFVIISFSSVSISRLLIFLNLLSFFFYLIRERFHTNHWHISLACAGGSFVFMFSDWLIDAVQLGFNPPPIISWVSLSISTLVFAPPFVFLLDKIDQKIAYERIDTLQNLRI